MPKALQNFEKASNMPKIWQKPYESRVQLALTPFFGWLLIPENLISGTRSVTIIHITKKEEIGQLKFKIKNLLFISCNDGINQVYKPNMKLKMVVKLQSEFFFFKKMIQH